MVEIIDKAIKILVVFALLYMIAYALIGLIFYVIEEPFNLRYVNFLWVIFVFVCSGDLEEL